MRPSRRPLQVIDLVTDKTKGTRDYVTRLRSAAAELRRNDCKWTLWISLSKKGPTKRSADAAIPGAGRGCLL